MPYTASESTSLVGRRWVGQSWAGRRLALTRKFEVNVAHYGGRVGMLTLTPPGQDVLPWDESGRRVEWAYASVWNCTAQKRASRLFEAAQRSADRWVRRGGWGGALPRQIGNAVGWQERGLKHFHWLLPMESETERAWSRHVERFIAAAHRKELARWSAGQRWEMVWGEYGGGKPARGFYGFGFKKGARHGGSSEKAARYLAKNAAGYVAGQGGRHYVSVRLTRETGVTMRALRACNWLHVRRVLMRKGELDGAWLPGYWSPEWSWQVLRVLSLVEAARAP